MTTRRALKHTIVQVYEVVPNKKPTLEDLREKTVYDSDGQVLYTITIEPLPPVQGEKLKVVVEKHVVIPSLVFILGSKILINFKIVFR
ncbi:unnamed protein product [Caenorhabditis brenneri]